MVLNLQLDTVWYVLFQFIKKKKIGDPDSVQSYNLGHVQKFADHLL